jgi:hypothetical protein
LCYNKNDAPGQAFSFFVLQSRKPMMSKTLSWFLLLLLCLELPTAGSAQPLAGSLVFRLAREPLLLTPRMYLPVIHSYRVSEVKPVFIFPVDGEMIDFSSTWVFQVQPIPNASGYLWGFEQNGVLVWENYRNEGTLSGDTYTIYKGSYAHSLFTTGALKVWVRALIYNEWTDLTIVNIFLI